MDVERVDLGYRKCDDQDFAKFYAPNKSAKNRVEKLKADKIMYCLNGTDDKGQAIDFQIWGGGGANPHRRL